MKYIGEGLYLTVCREMSPNEDSIFFLEVNMFTSCISLQGRGILEELILSIPLFERAIFHRTLFIKVDLKASKGRPQSPREKLWPIVPSTANHV